MVVLLKEKEIPVSDSPDAMVNELAAFTYPEDLKGRLRELMVTTRVNLYHR